MRYVKKPIVIEAMQFLENGEILEQLSDFMDMQVVIDYRDSKNPVVKIATLEGVMEASVGDYIIKGIQGEFYPCKEDIFNATYKPVSEDKNTFDFGLAVKYLKQGKKVARSGWNGKGMFVVYQKGYPDGIPCNKQTAEAWGLNEGDLFRVEPYLQIKMVNGSHAMWVPSINDVLADDWEVVDES